MTIRWVTIIIFLASLTAAAEGEDQRQEELLFNVYKKYNSQPTSQEVWERALGDRTAQEYTIVKGDTLWDVSKTLFADGFFWSKVWSLNPFITNPHEIAVGQVIHFYLGAGLEAPGMKVAEQAQTPVLTPETPMAQTTWWLSQNVKPGPIDLTDVVLPPPTKKFPAVLNTFPSSLPSWYFQTDNSDRESKIEIVPTERAQIESVLSLPFYISDLLPNEKGRIFEIEKNAEAGSERDFLFIEADEDLAIGKIYTAIKPVGKIRDPDAVIGYPVSYEVQGEVKIVGEVEGLYKAQVVKSLCPIEIDSIIIPGRSPQMNLSTSGRPANIKAMIIGGENDTTRKLFGPQSIVFLNRGSEDDIKLNQQAPVMAVHRMRHAESSIYSNTWKIGEVKIVKVEKNYATAIIMNATEGIVPGDMIGEFSEKDVDLNFKQLNANTTFGDQSDGIIKTTKRRTEDVQEEEEFNREKSDDGSDEELEPDQQSDQEENLNEEDSAPPEDEF